MATEKEVLALDLDSKGFVAGAKDALNALKQIGDDNSIAELIEKMKTFGKVAGTVAAAVAVLKTAVDFTLEAEQVKQVNAQFDAMAQSAGLAADVLREQLSKATRGLVDDTDALQIASRSIGMLGEQAGRLPAIFELARKAVQLYGGTFEEQVERFSRAIATGNTMSLKHLGLVIDMEKASVKYAISIGTTVDKLSDQQKRQAAANAIMEKAQSQFKNISDELMPLTVLITQIGVVFKDMAETIAVAVGRVVGPSLVKFAGWLKEAATGVSLYLKEKLGDATTSAEAHLERLKRKYKDLSETLAELEALQARVGRNDPFESEQRVARIEKIRASLAKLKEEIGTLDEKKPKAGAPEEGGFKVPGSVTPEAAAQAESERMALILKMRELEYGAAKDSTAIWINEEQERAAYIETIRAESESRIAAIHAAGPGKVANAAEKELLIRKETADKIKKINTEAEASKQKTFAETYSKLNKGQQVLTSGMIAGFKSIGGGAKEMARAMKAAMLGVIADEAEASGAKFIAEGIASWPFGAPKIAGGSALVALAGLLRSAGGSGGGIGVGGGGGGGGGAPTAPAGTPATTATGEYSPRPELVAPQRGRQVTIAIAGNYFETEQTRRQLVEMIRQETDATAFAYTTISQGAV